MTVVWHVDDLKVHYADPKEINNFIEMIRLNYEDATGKVDTLEYITYDRVPQTRYVRGLYGQLVRQTYYVKVETGRVTVELVDGVVASVAESEDKGRGKDGTIKIIPAPIYLF